MTILIIFVVVIILFGLYKIWNSRTKTESKKTLDETELSSNKDYEHAKNIVQRYSEALAVGSDGTLRKISLLKNSKSEIEQAILYLSTLDRRDEYMNFISKKLTAIFICLDQFVDDERTDLVNSIGNMKENGISLSDGQLSILKNLEEEINKAMFNRIKQITSYKNSSK